MPLPRRARLAEYTNKGAAVIGRATGIAPELRAARAIGTDLSRLPHPSPGAPRVLFVSPRDWAFHNHLEGLLAAALRLRGAEVAFVGCGGGLEISDRSNAHEAPPMPCRSCTRYNAGSVGAFGHAYSVLADEWDGTPAEWPELDGMTLDQLEEVEDQGLPLGRMLAIPVRWFLLSSQLEADALAEPTYRAFLRSGRRIAGAVQARIDAFAPDVVVLLNGLFSFEALTAAVCARAGIDYVTYERTHRAGALIFRRNGAANRYDLSGLWARRVQRPLTVEQDAALDAYLDSRRVKGHPLLDIWADATVERHARPEGGRLVTMFANVTWDSSVQGRDRCFESMHDWIKTTVDLFAARPLHRLVIRAHPAELKRSGKWTREPVSRLIDDRAGGPPPNVRLIRADDPTSSYPLMEDSDIGLVYTSTTGIEMAVMGKPVVVAGEAHYRGLGFTNDPDDRDAYAHMVDGLLADPGSGVLSVETARRYAYTFFFEAPIPLRLVEEPYPGLVRHTVGALSDLEPGRDTGLDRVCHGILGMAEDPLERTYFLPPA